MLLEQPLPCEVKAVPWLLTVVNHCPPLTVSSVSPTALPDNCLVQATGPLGSSLGCSGGPMVLIKHDSGRTQWSHSPGGGISDGVLITFSAQLSSASLLGRGGHR